ncbi:MAG: TldD/PmbA family protein [Leptospiraceae bacterium]|nr:TldD/PmbA family protein [Leptospiraceae bacterium]
MEFDHLQEACEFVAQAARARGCEQFEVLGTRQLDQELSVYQSRLNKSSYAESQALGMRVFVDGRPGYAWSARLGSEALLESLAHAMANAALADPLDLEMPDRLDVDDLDLELWSPDWEDWDFARMSSLALEAAELARQSDRRIVNVPLSACQKSSRASYFINSRGVSFEKKSGSVVATCGVTARQKDITKSGYYSQAGRGPLCLQADTLGQNAVERALELLDIAPVPSLSAIPVVLSHRVSGRLFALYQSMFFAEQVQKNQSRLAGRMGESIAVSELSLRSMARVPGWPASRLVDSEGMATQDIPLVEGGCLQNWLYHLESAARDGCASNGAATRSLAGVVSTCFANLVVDRGPHTLEQLLHTWPQCLYVLKLEGAAACSAVSGEISIGAQGWFMVDGQKVHAFDGLTLSMNFLDLLQNIALISNEWSPQWSLARVPDLAIQGFAISQ